MSRSPLRWVVRRGAYRDSLALMGLRAALEKRQGIRAAAAVMASAANLELLRDSGLAPEPLPEAGAEDLLVVVRATSQRAADEALAQMDDLLRSGETPESDAFRPKSLRGARRPGRPASHGVDWAIVSVPGEHAAAVTRDAFAEGLNVFLYSDNVSLEDELALKRRAADLDLLLLGPDCGTAIIDGIGLGFANRVRRGRVGLVGASGTGLQLVAVALHRLGGGVSQAIGTGGRDLSREIGGATTLRALDRLERDADTDVIVLVSKRPAPEIARLVLAKANALAKPVVVYFQGADPLGSDEGHVAPSLEDAALRAQRLALGRPAAPGADRPPLPGGEDPPPGRLLGLFGGGTLAAELLWRLRGRLAAPASNLAGPWRRVDAVDLVTPGSCERDTWSRHLARGDLVLDLGDDTLTRGRPHPMLDPGLQAELLLRLATAGDVGTVAIDIVLGDGAHPDPASILAPAIERVLAADSGGRSRRVVALLVGTDEDPQDVAAQRERLESAGARVARAFGELTGLVLGEPVLGEPIGAAAPLEAGAQTASGGVTGTAAAGESPRFVNVGLETFHHALLSQGAPAVHVDWRPPAGGKPHLAAIVERIKERDRSSGRRGAARA